MFYQIKKSIPKPLKQLYHYFMARVAALWYGFPSEKMIVIGVTGTKGKSTTSNLIGRVLEGADVKVGFATTANFKIAEKEWLNDTKMTMLGRFRLQKMLSEMVKVGCKYAIVESSSQGIEQFRHLGINYDTLVFTNLSPEHIEAHGGFDKYRKAKGKLFARLKKLPHKILNGKSIPKRIVANLDDDHVNYFLSFWADEKIGYTLRNTHGAQVEKIYTCVPREYSMRGVAFSFEGTDFAAPLVGEHNLYNLTAALAVAFEEGVAIDELKDRVRHLQGVPGRMEFINEGQDFSIVVDYAYDPKGMEELYKALQVMPRKRLIQVLGGSGGGRDQARQAVLGSMAGQHADLVIVTTDDPFDDDPRQIADRVSEGTMNAGKKIGESVFLVPDRKEAIAQAVILAQAGDMVLITGKGAEQFIASKNGQKIPHDDRQEARKALQSRISNS